MKKIIAAVAFSAAMLGVQSVSANDTLRSAVGGGLGILRDFLFPGSNNIRAHGNARFWRASLPQGSHRILSQGSLEQESKPPRQMLGSSEAGGSSEVR